MFNKSQRIIKVKIRLGKFVVWVYLFLKEMRFDSYTTYTITTNAQQPFT